MSAAARKTGKSCDPVATPSAIAGALRERIVLGEIEAGTPLRQDRIAADFGVSHIPVREALQELVAGGLAVFVRNRGVVVSELSVDLAWELTEYRCLLEGQMARWAVPALTSQDIAEAKEILDRLDRTTKTAEILSLNTAFHAALFRPANRPFFLKSIEIVRANLARYWRLAWEDLGYKPHSQQEHRKILALCRKKDAEAVGREMEDHIRETGALIISYLKRRSQVE
jgi:DNA-binding GntR family transcriptional regulator